MTTEEFPEAEVRSRQARSGWPVLSRMWWATGLCVLAAVGLTWYSLEPRGTEILLHFQDGHGLKAGDPLRHRGIDVGRVVSVGLNDQLSGIDVRAELSAAAKGLAREGSRFWIVRPTVDLSGISGLETAVGSKYIAVAPGPAESGEQRLEFSGLETPPVDGSFSSGIELVLRGAKRYGISPGAPLTWRGVEVGQVLSCGLSPDALQVDVLVRIDANHQRLINSATRFWVLSGVQFDAGLTGLKVSAESLATVVRGGIGLITPESKNANPVRAGDVFTLHPEEDQSWTANAVPLNLLELSPPAMLPLLARWQQKTLGFTRTLERRSLGVPVEVNGEERLLVPSSFLEVPAESLTGSFQVAWEALPENRPAPELGLSDASPSEGLLSKLKLPASGVVALPANRQRIATEPEDCFVARQAAGGEVFLESLGRQELNATGERWTITKPSLNRAVWQGAAVLSARDGKLIGLLITDGNGACVAPIR